MNIIKFLREEIAYLKNEFEEINKQKDEAITHAKILHKLYYQKLKYEKAIIFTKNSIMLIYEK